MRDFRGLAYASLPDVKDPQFAPRVRGMFSDLDYFLRDLSMGMGRIQKGQIPDGSGSTIPVGQGGTLTDYLFLPGRTNGQTIHGIDANPAIMIDSGLISTAVIGATGVPFERYQLSKVPLLDFLPYVFDGTTTDLALRPFSTAGGIQVLPVDGTSGIRLLATASRAFIQCGRKDSSNLVQESSLTLGGQGATVLKRLDTEAQFVSLNVTGAVGQNGAVMTANTARVGVNIDPFDFSSSVTASQSAGLHLLPISTSTTDPACLVLERRATTQPMFEIREGSAGASPNKTLGLPSFQVDGFGSIRWFTGGTRRLRIRTLGDAGSETGNSGIQVLNASDRLQFETIPETAVWADTVSSLTIRAANTATEVNRLALCSQSSVPFSRLGICATSTVLGPASVGVIPAPLSSRILTVVDSSGTVLSGLSSAGAYFFVSGGATGKVWTSDSAGLGSWSTIGSLTADFADNLFTIHDDGDTTKKLAFQVSGVATATTRTLTVPNLSGTIDLIDAAQTFTAVKTFDADNGGAPIISGLDDGATTLFTIHGSSSGFDMIFQMSTLSAGRTVLFPDGSGAIVLAAAAQTLSAKTLSSTTLINCGASGVLTGAGTKLTRASSTTIYTQLDLSALSTTRVTAFPDITSQISMVGDAADPPASSGQIGKVNRTAQAAAVGSTVLTNATPAGMYLIHYEMTCTTGDGTAGTMTFDVICTGDQGAQTVSSAALDLKTATVSGTNPIRGTQERYLASGNITYTTTVTGAVNAARYALRVRCEFLG